MARTKKTETRAQAEIRRSRGPTKAEKAEMKYYGTLQPKEEEQVSLYADMYPVNDEIMRMEAELTPRERMSMRQAVSDKAFEEYKQSRLQYPWYRK